MTRKVEGLRIQTCDRDTLKWNVRGDEMEKGLWEENCTKSSMVRPQGIRRSFPSTRRLADNPAVVFRVSIAG